MPSLYEVLLCPFPYFSLLRRNWHTWKTVWDYLSISNRGSFSTSPVPTSSRGQVTVFLFFVCRVAGSQNHKLVRPEIVQAVPLFG